MLADLDVVADVVMGNFVRNVLLMSCAFKLEYCALVTTTSLVHVVVPSLSLYCDTNMQH